MGSDALLVFSVLKLLSAHSQKKVCHAINEVIPLMNFSGKGSGRIFISWPRHDPEHIAKLLFADESVVDQPRDERFQLRREWPIASAIWSSGCFQNSAKAQSRSTLERAAGAAPKRA